MNESVGTSQKHTSIAIFSIAIVMYLGAGLIAHLKMRGSGATEIHLSQVENQCSESECVAKWQFISTKRFVLLGQILRSHQLRRLGTDGDVLPITVVSGTMSDSWLRLNVYQVEPGERYEIVGKKPLTARMGYFVGIRPREANDSSILTVPHLVESIQRSGLLLALVSVLILLAALAVSTKRLIALNPVTKTEPGNLQICALLLIGSLTLSTGLWDAAIPEGNYRNAALRSLMTAACLMFVIPDPRLNSVWTRRLWFAIKVVVLITGSLMFWPFLRQATYWSAILFLMATFGAVKFYRQKDTVSALMWGCGILDAGRVIGLIQIVDYPPVYVFNVLSLSALGLAAGNAGGFVTIGLLGKLYRRIRRDFLLDSINQQFHSFRGKRPEVQLESLKSVLPMLGEFLHCGRITITINLPLGRPVTYSFDSHTKTSEVFDDGTIPGAVTLRSLLYGDSALFESFAAYSKRLGFGANTSLSGFDLFCIIPIRVNEQVVGTIMMTKFKDAALREKMVRADGLTEERENIRAVLSVFEGLVSSMIVRDLNSASQVSRDLHKMLHLELALCERPADFLSLYARSIAYHCKCAVAIHTKIGDQGVAVAHCGLPSDAWAFLSKHPLKLATGGASPIGPTVVAFMERRSSYVKDVREIKSQMHPMTQSLFELMRSESIAAIPLAPETRNFVVTLFTMSGDPPASPSVVQVVESTEAIFVAALEVMSQRSSVVALGELTSRLIGDKEIRTKIIEAAKARNLPTTIGKPKTSFLLLFDLVGSSDLSHDTELKARAYGNFYDLVNKKAQEQLRGVIRKTIGDAVIITWDGSDHDPSIDPNFVHKLRNLAQYADFVAKDIGCKGARAILHYGKYFLGLVGTETFGQIDVIGSGIDEVCKLEGLMKHIVIDGSPAKLAISCSAIEKISSQASYTFVRENLVEFDVLPTSRFNIKFACTLISGVRTINHAAR